MSTEMSWYNLDNQANIYPAINDAKNTNVYRLSCAITEDINPDILQAALDKSMKSFAYYNMIIRRGLFWYYLEATNLSPEVILENYRPCRQIFYQGERTLLFQVSYFKKRINLEAFHALADGGGAIEFFKDIVYNYISIAFKESLPDILPPLTKTASPASKAEDAFLKHYTSQGVKNSPFSEKAYIIDGTTIPFNNISVISARIKTQDLISLAKKNDATLTAYLTTLLICAIESESMPKRYISRDVAISVPVDLRTMFPTQSYRNFFSVVSIRYNFENSPKDFASVLKSVSQQLREMITPERLLQNLNYNMAMQKSYFTRWIPLVVKNKILRLAYKRSESTNTTILSNLGRIEMPHGFSDYIDYFTCLLNPTPIHKTKICLNSFKDGISIDFTSNIEETDIQRYIIRHFSNHDIHVTITSNRSD